MNTMTQPISYTQNIKRSQSRDSVPKGCETKVGVIKLQIHELMMQRVESEVSLLLKLYLNDNLNEYYSVNSLRQG